VQNVDDVSARADGVEVPRGEVTLIVLLDREGPFLPPRTGRPLVRLGLAELRRLQDRLGDQPTVVLDGPGDERFADLEAHARHHLGRTAPVGLAPDPGPSAPIDATGPHRIVTPVAIRATGAGYDFVDHDGAIRARLDPRAVAALVSFVEPREPAAAFEDQRERLGDDAMDAEAFGALLGSLLDAGIVRPLAGDVFHDAEGRAEREMRAGIQEVMVRSKDVEKGLDARRIEEALRVERTGRVRTKVVPVNNEGHPILSLGLAMAHAEAYDSGRLTEEYEFVPDWADKTVPRLTEADPPAIYLFSNYIWSHAWNVVRSGEVKERSPHSLTIHGGPNTPKYADDVQAFFRMNPHVDISVHGEGEATFVHLLEALSGCFEGGRAPDLEPLREVPGITFRMGDEIVQTAKRDRIADLDTIPSPYLSGLFDDIGESGIFLMTVETNRGCPYGCTFCDWGSATLSRIRKFDLQRVYDELEWCARHKVRMIFCADANFGIFARDVDIARKVVELKQQYGYPTAWESSYAKNTVKHLREIIEILSEGGVLSSGTLSLQSLDQPTLDTIRRSNIRVDKYEELAVEFGNNELPLVMELMMGLPGSTVTSMVGDLQQIIDREVRARVNPTEVLMNSPMNDPEYRDEHKIETLRPVNHDWREDFITRKKSLIVSTETFTRDDYALMERYRLVFLLCENFGALRQVARFVRQATSLTESEFYVQLANDVYDTDDWPLLRFTLEVVTEYMIPPASWRLVLDELHRYLVDRLDIEDDSALATVLRVQHALLPSRDRSFPVEIELAHDYAGWHKAMLTAKRSGSALDWPGQVPRLEEFGPARFEVDDPQQVTVFGMGMSLFYDGESDWELASPVARPIRFRHTIHV